MDTILSPNMPVWLMAIIVLLLILLFNWFGFIYRRKQMENGSFSEPSGMNIIESSLMGLTALLLGFTFSMVATKFDNRRHIIIEEANHIGTAILRCDLYPDSIRSLLRADFRQYVEARIASYNAGADEQKIQTALDTAALYSARIWQRVTLLSHNPANLVRTGQMIPALNNMIDIVTTRDADRKNKVPRLILLTLLTFSLLSAFLSGYGNKAKRRNLLMVGAFAFTSTFALYLIMELDRPKQGFINVYKSEQYIESLREMLHDK